jgi:hypothetical protein
VSQPIRIVEQVLQRQMNYYSTNPNADRIAQVQGEIDEVKKVMVENIGVWAGFGFPHLPIWAALCSLLCRHALVCLAIGLDVFSWFHDWHWPQLYDANS